MLADSADTALSRRAHQAASMPRRLTDSAPYLFCRGEKSPISYRCATLPPLS